MEIKKLENDGVQLFPQTASDHVFLSRLTEMVGALDEKIGQGHAARAAENVAAELAAGAMAKGERNQMKYDGMIQKIEEALSSGCIEIWEIAHCHFVHIDETTKKTEVGFPPRPGKFFIARVEVAISITR